MKNKNECFILQRKMKRLIFSILFIVPVGLYSANHKKWKQTASGIFYKIYTNDTAKLKPVYGDHIWMHLRKFSPKKKKYLIPEFLTPNAVWKWIISSRLKRLM